METNLENIQEVKRILSPLAKVTDDFFTTATIGKISKAIADAQTSLEKVIKNTDNSFFRSKYADLATVIDVTREFAKHGVAITQHPFFANDMTKVGVVTILSHESGEAIGSRLEMTTPADKKPQSIGATITYARRYALAALTNVAQEDDDGNVASGRDAKQPNQQPQPPKQQSKSNTPPPPAQHQPQNVQSNNQPAQQPHQKTAEEVMMEEKTVRLNKLPAIIATNEWFATDINTNPKYGKPNGKFGMQEIVKFVCNAKERVEPASMTLEQIDEVLRFSEYIANFFKNGGQPGAGPADVWIANMHKAMNNPNPSQDANKYSMF